MAVNGFLTEFKQDRVYSEFLNDAFNLQSTITLINNLPFNEQLAKISQGIDYVKQNISQLTSQNCEDFFQRTAKLDHLYEELRFISIRAQNLSKTLELMKSKLETPYQELCRQIALISRLQKTCDLLRKMLRILHLVKRIDDSNLDATKNEQTVFLKELVKVSQYINEIDMIVASDDEQLLFKLHSITKDLERYEKTKSTIRDEAETLLKNGLAALDVNLIGTAFQVFHNLGNLNETISTLVSQKCDQLSHLAPKLFAEYSNLRGQSKSSMSNKQLNVLKTIVRNNIKMLLDTVMTHFSQVSTSVKVLKKRRDNYTQTLLIDFIDSKETVVTNFWNEVLQILSSAFARFFNEHELVKHLIESDYPNILSIFNEYWKRIIHEEQELNDCKTLRSTISQFESAYLSNSLSLLFESVNRIFTTDAKDSSSHNQKASTELLLDMDIQPLLKDIENQMTVAMCDSQLAGAVCKNVLKTINLFLVKCEHLISVDGSSTQVIGRFTTSQRRNAKIVHLLHHFSKQTRQMMESELFTSQQSIKQSVEDALCSVNTLIQNIFEPLITSVQESIEDIIVTMHNENYCISSDYHKDSTQYSLYMKELQRFISRVSQDYFGQFPQCDPIQQRIHEMAARTIELFLLHVCLVRPVSEAGRKQIGNDFAQFELAIGPICQRMGHLGLAFQTLRAFQTLLLLPAEEIAKSPVVGNPVPHHLLLHFLISNYATEELKSPHQCRDWSISRYSKWILDRPNQEEKLFILREALDSYVNEVKRSQKKTFISVYPLLIEMMRHTLQQKTDDA